MDTTNITHWIFDLDNTLYAPEVALFDQIERRMTDYVMRKLGMSQAQADHLRSHYWRLHGTTLAGLMEEHLIDPDPYLADVHDIDFSVLTPDPALAAAIAALPGRKIIHTNADSDYAGKVLAHRGLDGFDAIYGIKETGYLPKPHTGAYEIVREAEGFDPARAVMFEDDPRNLNVPHFWGMATVLVGEGRHGPDLLAADHDHGPHVGFRTCDLVTFLRALAEPAKARQG